MLIERRLWATAEVQGLKGRIWSCQGSFACPFPSLTYSLPIKHQAVARYWRGKNDELSMFEIIITVSMATRKCPPWFLFVFWARRHEVKVCKQKAAGRDGGRGLCGTLPTILTHFRHTWLLLVCEAFFHLASAVGCNFGLWASSGMWERAREQRHVLFQILHYWAAQKLLPVGLSVLLWGYVGVSPTCFSMGFLHSAPSQGAQTWPCRDLPVQAVSMEDELIPTFTEY